MGASWDSLRISFLAAIAEDRRSGGLRPLEHYHQRFPGGGARLRQLYERIAQSERTEDSQPSDELGSYRLLRELGRGGQGVVWQALDTRLEREVALKVVRLSAAGGEWVPRFRREALVAAQLDHPGFCQVLDVGTDEDYAWIAMDQVHGEPLGSWAHRVRSEARGKRRIQRLFLRLAQALESAHGKGFVHRDLKPSNVLITAGDQPVILDWGAVHWNASVAPLTRSGQSIGTPAYMAPEALAGPGRAPDARLDVWGLGVMLYEAWSGVHPFDAPTRSALVRNVLQSSPRLLHDWSRDGNAVLHAALAKRPEERYSNCGALAEELGRLDEGRPVRARMPGPFRQALRWCRRRPALAASLAVASASILGSAAWARAEARGAQVARDAAIRLSTERGELLSKKDSLVAELDRLGHQAEAQDLIDSQKDLWPALPAQMLALDGWCQSAERILAQLPLHRATRAEIASRLDHGPKAVENAWLLEQYDELLGSLDDLAILLPRIQERSATARILRQRSLVDSAEDWRLAAQRVGQDARFGGFQLQPQLGLLPLGPDPKSGLEEFAHLLSGPAPERDLHDGGLELEGDFGVILVLIPGGERTVGAVLPEGGELRGEAHVDADLKPWEVGRRTENMHPFFIGKHEFTQGQWLAHTGDAPSSYTSHERAFEYPVEQVRWSDAVRVLEELALELPTERHWEVAARGGTSSVYFTGNDIAALAGAVNLCDLTVQRSHQETGVRYTYCEWLDDGYVGPAPVTALGTNPYGLHHVVGNVFEWCRDAMRLEDQPLTRIVDEAQGKVVQRAIRGGSFISTDDHARMASRVGFPLDGVSRQMGLRAMRQLDEVEPGR